MVEDVTLQHGGFPWHEFFLHPTNNDDVQLVLWIAITLTCLYCAYLIMSDLEQNHVKQPNKRLEEWKAKHHNGEDS